GQGLRGLLEYNTDLFAAETATRFAEHFVNLLESVVSDPLQPVSRIEILSERERRHLLKSPIEQQPHVWERQALHQIFAHNARRRPKAVAGSVGEQQIKYAELNGRASELAQKLRSLGVAGECIVGILLERSVEMMVAVLGILKAGGAYLPLEPDLPEERVGYMLEDSGAGWVVTGE